ncbi:YgcG family protein [Novosphingobium sp. G106]|uniref:TPM domain-containing protein n=1 Tax=Novosphingobium sp. G106 TaxID=2849500 RepID=UPI0020C417BE|nr:TPM domain-containing protein [Novosphingobium sp. G106]
MRHLLTLWFALLVALAGFVAPAQAAPTFPPLTGRVVDAANILPPDVKTRLDQKLAGLQTQSGRQLVVVTLPDLQGYEISDYGYQLGRAWGIGSKDKNDGALLIIAPNERKLRIEVGYGLEGVLTDGLSSLIINQQIVPKFKAGDMPGGIEAGTDAIIQQLTLPADQAQKIAAEANRQPAKQQGGGFPWVFLIFVFLFFILPMLRGGGRRYRSGGLGSVILWDALNSSRGGGGGWGGGGGGGGFSGGGGSFGGGGSSGSW